MLFGCVDGCVYCLRLADGELAWRFRAAAEEVKTVALDQVESVWPVHGNVLTQDGIAYFAAGRSSWLDGAENHRSHWVFGTGDFSRLPVAYPG